MTARGCKRPCRDTAPDLSIVVSPFAQWVSKTCKFNEELAQADILLAGEGLHPSSKFFAAVPPERSLSYGCSGENPRY